MLGLQSGFVPGDHYNSRIGLVGYPKVVNTQHPLSCQNLFPCFLSFFLPFFSLYHFIGPCRPPKSAAKFLSSFLLTGRWLPNTKKNEEGCCVCVAFSLSLSTPPLSLWKHLF